MFIHTRLRRTKMMALFLFNYKNRKERHEGTLLYKIIPFPQALPAQHR